MVQTANQCGLKPSEVHKSWSIVTAALFAFSAIASFPQLLKCDSYQYSNVLLPCRILLATLLYLTSFEQCSTKLLKVLHKGCNTKVLGVLLIYPHSPLCVHHVFTSVKPLAAVLQPINAYL